MKEGIHQFQQVPNLDSGIDMLEREIVPGSKPPDSDDEKINKEEEIGRLEQLINSTETAIDNARKELGLLPSTQEAPSVLSLKDKITDLRAFSRQYHNPSYRNQVAQNLRVARKVGNTDAVLEPFYSKTETEKEQFESQENERDITSLMKEKDLLFLHSMPLATVTEGFAEYNRSIDVGKINFDDRYKILLGAQPVISVSVPSPERADNGLFRRSGVVLGGGRILSAKKINTFSTAHGLYKRVPGAHDQENPSSAIQSNIDLDAVVKRTEATKGLQSLEDNNEITVESPDIAGLYYDLTLNDKPFDATISWMGGAGTENERRQRYEDEINQANKMTAKEFEEIGKKSVTMNVPLYVIKKSGDTIGKFKVEFDGNPGESEQYIEEVLRPKGREISQKYGRDSVEFKSFVSNEFNPAILNKKSTPYKLVPVTAEQILTSEQKVSDEERAKTLEDLIAKNVFSNPNSLREAQQRLKDLRGSVSSHN